MNISTLRKIMLLTMKTIENPDSVSEEEREKNKTESIQAYAAYAYAYGDEYAAYDGRYAADYPGYDVVETYTTEAKAADAAARAAEYVYLGDYKEAQKWVDIYFKYTGENKQDYIDAIEADLS